MVSREEVTQKQLWGPMIAQAEVVKRLWKGTNKNLLTHHWSCRHFVNDRGKAPIFRTPPKNADSSHVHVRLLLLGYRKGITINISADAGIYNKTKSTLS